MTEELRKKISIATKKAMQNPLIRKKISIANSKRIVSKETRLKMSIASKGRKHTEETKLKLSKIFKGHPVSKETRQKLSKHYKGKLVGNKNPFYGKKHTLETRLKISKNQTGKNNHNYGKPRSEETKRKISESNKGNRNSLGYKQTEEDKKKKRLAAINRIIRNKGQINPNYNLKSQDYFRQFDNENNTNGRFAENGGEHYIKELGYWVDYFNKELKLIIEWDEKAHYDNQGNLRMKDILRQNNIQELFPDFEFIRIKEKKYA